jgi:hypothetical protein
MQLFSSLSRLWSFLESRIQLSLPSHRASSVLCTVARIALVKPDKARGVEDLVIRMAQMGQITEKVRRSVTVEFELLAACNESMHVFILVVHCGFFGVWICSCVL